jgi:hypothetical protein
VDDDRRAKLTSMGRGGSSFGSDGEEGGIYQVVIEKRSR